MAIYRVLEISRDLNQSWKITHVSWHRENRSPPVAWQMQYSGGRCGIGPMARSKQRLQHDCLCYYISLLLDNQVLGLNLAEGGSHQKRCAMPRKVSTSREPGTQNITSPQVSSATNDTTGIPSLVSGEELCWIFIFGSRKQRFWKYESVWSCLLGQSLAASVGWKFDEDRFKISFCTRKVAKPLEVLFDNNGVQHQ